MKIFAHRGGMAGGFENTLAAIRRSIELGADGIEVDLRTTADGVTVVMHDRDVDRTTDGAGAVAEQTFDELRRLSVGGGGGGIPTLDEVLALLARNPRQVELLLDIKRQQRTDACAVAKKIRDHGLTDRTVFGVRTTQALAEYRRAAPEVRCLALAPSAAVFEDYLTAHALRLWHKWLREMPDLLESTRSLGLAVWVTSGSPTDTEIRGLRSAGIDALLVDDPAVALAALED